MEKYHIKCVSRTREPVSSLVEAKSSLIIFLVYFSSVFASCDPVSTFEFEIRNSSSKQLKFVHADFGQGEIVLHPGASKVIYGSETGSYTTVKNNYKNRSYCPCALPGIQIDALDPNVTLAKKLDDCNAWTHEDKKDHGASRGGKFTCVFEVKNEDLK